EPQTCLASLTEEVTEEQIELVDPYTRLFALIGAQSRFGSILLVVGAASSTAGEAVTAEPIEERCQVVTGEAPDKAVLQRSLERLAQLNHLSCVFERCCHRALGRLDLHADVMQNLRRKRPKYVHFDPSSWSKVLAMVTPERTNIRARLGWKP